MSHLVAVTGAAGKTGQAIIAALAARGIESRALVHRDEQAAETVPHAAETTAVELTDRTAIDEALAGTSAVYLIAPNMHPDEPGLLENVINSCESAGPRTIVYHSVIHPYLPQMPHHIGKAQTEARLHASSLDWAIVQPASYFENALGVWDSVRETGTWPLPYSEQAPFTPVALHDIADSAAIMLGDLMSTEPRYLNATLELAGPERLTTADMARIAGEVLQRDVQVTVDRNPVADRPAPLQAMFDYYDKSGICGNGRILDDLLAKLGRTPMIWRDWVQQHG